MSFVDEFRAAIEAAGLVPPERIEADGKRHRFSSSGKRGDDAGWYILHGDDRPAGAFGCWRAGVSESWRASAKREFTPEERAAWRARMQQIEAEREAERREAVESAAKRAAEMWERGRPANGHPYLLRKGIEGVGARELGDALLIPMRHGPGQIVGLQCIQPDGSRKFLSGTPAAGAYTSMGQVLRRGKIVVVEGYATGVSVYWATGWPVIVAFSSGNLRAVAEKMRAALPEVEIIVAADDDAFTAGNPGLAAAHTAARAVGGRVAVPAWSGERGKGTDFNDLHQAEGIEAVKACFADDRLMLPEPESADARVENGEPAQPTDASPGSRPYRSAEEVEAGNVVWTEPADLFRQMSVPRIQAEWLPPGLAPYVFDQADLIGTDPEIVALSCLMACAGAADDRIKIQPARNNPGWLESPRLWGAIVGEPSIKKSPAISRAVSRLRKLDIDLGEKAAAILAEHAIKEAVYAKKVKEYTDRAAKDEDPGPMPTKPEQPILERLIVEDITVEALSEILKANPRGVLCLADELSGWFGAMDAYSGNKTGAKDRSHWLEIYNGGPRKIDRIGRGSIIVPNWSACMLGGIQPDAIRRIAANMPADGLLQRFMVVIGQSVRPGVDRVPDLPAQDAYRDLLDQIFSIRPPQDPIKLSVDAKAAHDEIVAFAHQMIGLRVLPAGLASHLGKWEGLAPRLMITYHIIESAYTQRYPPPEIAGETAWRVRNFMMRFLFRHALAFYSDVLGDNGYVEAVRWIGGYILAKGCTEITNRDLLRDYSWWKQAKEWERATVMQRLIDFGWLLPKNPERDRFKALPTSLLVNPAVPQAFAERAKQERERRHAVREMMRENWGE